MNRTGAVKLISLEIIIFEQLEPGKVEWKYDSEMNFDVINTQPGKKHTQIFQAFRFGFGCDASTKKAGVIVTLQQNAQMIHFSHSKSSDSNQTYSIKIDGIDEEFRVVDREQYIDELVKLKVFASTMSFMFGDDLQCVLPENDHDLRQHLEKHLMNKPDVLNDYDDINGDLQALFEQKTSIATATKMADRLKNGIESEIENRLLKSEALVGKKDINLLEAFDHSKHLEELSRNEVDLQRHVADASNVQKEEVINQLKNWDTRMDNYPLHQLADEVRKNCSSSFSEQGQKEIESLQAKIQSLKLLFRVPPSFSTDKFRTIKLEIELDDARVKLKQAEIDHKITEISAGWDAIMRSHQNPEKKFRKVSGNKFINVEAIDSSPVMKEANRIKENYDKMDTGEDYDAEPYTFRIPSLDTQGDVRPYLDRIPSEGVFTVKTPDLKTHEFVSSLLNGPYKSKKRVIYIHSCDPNDKRPYPKLPLQISVEAKKVLTSDPIPMDSATSELRKLTKKLEDKEYIIGKKRENIDNKQFESVGKHVKQLEENVIRLEKQLAAKYRTDFAELFQQIPTIDQNDSKAVLNWVETWKQYRNIAALNQTMIGDLETKLDVVKKKEHEYNDRAAQKNALLEDLKREGEWIVADLDSLALKFFGPSALSANMALASSLRETIDCIKIQLTKWGLSFNPNEQVWAQAFYDNLSPQNKPTFESDDWSEIHLTVASKMNEIKNELQTVLETQGQHMGCPLHAFTKMKKDLMKERKQKVDEIVKLKSSSNDRNEAFELHFLNLQQYLQGLVQYCQPKWGVHLELSAQDCSPLDQSIHLMVDDRKLDSAFSRTVTLNHSVAALILQLAINITIDSQFIIIDGLNDFIEPCLIDPIMMLLKQLIKKHGIQIIFIKTKPEQEELATHTHHAWKNEKNIERMAETTTIVMMEEDAENTESEQSRMSIGSASSNSTASTSDSSTKDH